MITIAICGKCNEACLRKELREYMSAIGDITDDEKNNLYEWVASGNSAYDNPYYYSDDRGNPMDYISTMRVIKEQLAEMESLQANPAEAEQKWDEERDSLF